MDTSNAVVASSSSVATNLTSYVPTIPQQLDAPCSWCFQSTSHVLIEKSYVSRCVYQCQVPLPARLTVQAARTRRRATRSTLHQPPTVPQACTNRSLPCSLRCGAMARSHVSDLPDLRCYVCLGRISSWTSAFLHRLLWRPCSVVFECVPAPATLQAAATRALRHMEALAAVICDGGQRVGVCGGPHCTVRRPRPRASSSSGGARGASSFVHTRCRRFPTALLKRALARAQMRHTARVRARAHDMLGRSWSSSSRSPFAHASSIRG